MIYWTTRAVRPYDYQNNTCVKWVAGVYIAITKQDNFYRIENENDVKYESQ